MTDDKENSSPELPEPETSGPDHDAAESADDKPARPLPPRRSSGGNFLLWALVLVLLAGGGYLGWQQMQSQQRESAQLDRLQERLDRLSQQQEEWQQSSARELGNLSSNLSQQLTQLEQRQRDQSRETRDLEEQLAASLRALHARTGSEREAWLLAEAEYLLRMAGQRLVIGRDAGTALALLRGVDDMLRELANPELHLVRRSLSRDINALSEVEAVDREGIYLRLLSLSEQVNDLPKVAHPGRRLAAGLEDPDDDDLEDAELGLWDSVRRTFRRSVRNLNKYIRITRYEEVEEELLLPQDRERLVANLRLILEQANTAMLREETEIYRVSLGRAEKWLARHYPDSERAGQMREELQALMLLDVRPALPELGDSLALLRAHRQQRPREERQP